LVFFSIAFLNAFFAHFVPGIIYILLSFIYLPPFSDYLKVNFRFSFPIVLKLVLAILVLWFTIAVGDLTEMFEAWLRM